MKVLAFILLVLFVVYVNCDSSKEKPSLLDDSEIIFPKGTIHESLIDKEDDLYLKSIGIERKL